MPKDEKKKKLSLEDDDPLGAMFGSEAGKKPAGGSLEDAEADVGEVDDGAQALIDAVKAGDVAAVRDAFKSLSLNMSLPGEDDMEMTPESGLE